MTPQTVLHLDSSARASGSTTRALTGRYVKRLQATARDSGAPVPDIIVRDLAATPIPQITEDWVAANFTPAAERDAAQNAALALSDGLIEEMQRADTLLIGLPVYNFALPAALKAWIDQVARVGVTFRYTENGPEGLLTGKRAIVAMASGGTRLDSEIDFATGYLRHILGFMGITDVTFIAADAQMSRADRALSDAESAVDQLVA
ncbi:FMN-dependent NADH-azoreductase [Yunchengibacter salinarum]|uniref:FMN-dependent NADH-azoreductase n=1 Tax=Yunchengibacter salinarum TaxID=3133399 RepID=UPI0035B59333